MSSNMVGHFRFPVVRPELPPIEAWRPFAEEAYAANWFTNFGKRSERLEQTLAARWGHAGGACVVASSATAALAAPLIARGIEGPVLLPAFTFPATLAAVRMAGATPVLMDVAPATWSVAPDAFAEALARTGARAAVLVSPFGLKTGYQVHIDLACARGTLLVIDSAAGLGVERAPVETQGEVFEVYSMHATKPFGIGEGGAIFARTDQVQALRSALNFGLPDLGAEGGPAWGINGKLSEIPAAIGLAVAIDFDDRLARRRALAARYIETLAAFEHIAYRARVNDGAWQLFPVLLPSETAVLAAIDFAATRGMQLRRYYRPSLSTLPAFAGEPQPVSEDLAARMTCFPVYSWLADGEADEMVDIVDATIRHALAASRSDRS